MNYRKFLPQTYFDLSVTIKWLFVGLVDGVIVVAVQSWVYFICKNDFRDCVVDLLGAPVMVISCICLLGMIGVLLEWAYGKRHLMRKWIMDKWNQLNNNVVGIQAPGPEADNNGVDNKKLKIIDTIFF